MNLYAQGLMGMRYSRYLSLMDSGKQDQIMSDHKTNKQTDVTEWGMEQFSREELVSQNT